jgi:hypothetical protein
MRRPLLMIACAVSVVSVAASVCAFGVATASTPDPCAVIPASRLRSWFGKEVVSKPMRGGPQEQGCQWLPKDGSPGGLAFTLAPASSYSPPTRRFGYKEIAGIGDKAYIVPVQGGWEAGALKGGTAIWTRSPNLSSTIAPALLKMAVARL